MAGFFGEISPPPGVDRYGGNITEGGGPIQFANNILKFVIVIAGLYTFINLIIAGYDFLGSGGDAKKVKAAWEKIWQSLLGLAIVAGSFVLAAVFGWLIFRDPTAILNPKIYGPIK